MKYFTIVIFLVLCATSKAEIYQPATDEPLALAAPLPLTGPMAQLLQQVKTQPADTDLLKLVALYLKGARQPGYDNWFHEAEYWLSKISPASHTSIEYWLLVADIQQQQHKFDAALASLSQVFNQQAQHLTASLMAARVYLATAQHKAAKDACARLWQQDLFLFSVCSYEVAGRKGDWQQSYAALVTLYQRQQSLPKEIELWLRGILAEQAEQLGKTAEARNWLSPVLADAPTSLWLKWADLSLTLEDHRQVYQQLLVKHQQLGLADSLLVRLAAAEQELTEDSTVRAELAQRMQLRLARGDTEHAADLAHYFLRVAPNPQAALHWAELNYKSAKEPDDIALLRQSERALSRQQGKTQ